MRGRMFSMIIRRAVFRAAKQDAKKRLNENKPEDMYTRPNPNQSNIKRILFAIFGFRR
jgi:hypothetical protein